MVQLSATEAAAAEALAQARRARHHAEAFPEPSEERRERTQPTISEAAEQEAQAEMDWEATAARE